MRYHGDSAGRVPPAGPPGQQQPPPMGRPARPPVGAPPRPPGGGQVGPPPGWPPVPSTPPHREVALTLTTIALCLLSVLSSGATIWFFTRNDSSSVAPGTAEHAGGDGGAGRSGWEPAGPLGIDDPRPPEPIESPGGDGGEVGAAVLDAVRTAGFTYGRSEGYRAARISCHLTQPVDQVPTVQDVRIGIDDDEVVEVSADLEVDRPWENLPTADQADDPFAQGPDYDIRADAGRLLLDIGSAVVGESDSDEVRAAVRTAMEGTTVDIDTAAYHGWVSLSEAYGTLTLRIADEDNYGVAITQRPLFYLTATQVEKVIEEQGTSCERAAESSTCRADDVAATVHFPRPPGSGHHVIDKIEITAPAAAGGQANPTMVAVATALAEQPIAIYGNADGVGGWVSRCFGEATNRISQGGATLTCTPTLDGTVESPKIVDYTFVLR